MKNETIKSVQTARYEIILIQKGNAYYIHYDSKTMPLPRLSEALHDYNTASLLFDMKLAEFEGH